LRILLVAGITTIDNPTTKNWHIDVTSTNPLGATNQDLKNRNALGRQPTVLEHGPRNNILVSAAWAESKKHVKYDNLCAAAGTIFQPFALETTGGHGASTKAVYFLFNKHLRDSGVPGRGTEAQAQEGHLVRPASGNDRSGHHSTRRRPERRRGRARR
jgi:hypothetical protein